MLYVFMKKQSYCATAYIIFLSAYFLKASSATEFYPWRNQKCIVCSVNADFGRNVSILKFAYIVDYSLNCSDLHRSIEIVSPIGVTVETNSV